MQNLLNLLDQTPQRRQANPLDALTAARLHGIDRCLENILEASATPEQRRSSNLQRVAYGLKMIASLKEVVELFRSHELRLMVLKGPVISSLLYADPYYRSYGDLDLLVHSQDAAQAHALLNEAGYSSFDAFQGRGQRLAESKYLKARSYHHPQLGVSIDLHWRLLSQWVAHEPSFDELWSRRQSVQLETITTCQSLGNADQVIFLAFHGSQDGWQKLRLLVEFGLAVERLQYDPQELFNLVGNREPLLQRALTLAVDLLSVKPPQGFRPFFAGSEESLAFLLASMNLAPDVPQLALLSPKLWKHRSPAALQGAAKALLTPSTEDIVSVGLPQQLVNAYVLVRIYRLLVKLATRRQLK